MAETFTKWDTDASATPREMAIRKMRGARHGQPKDGDASYSKP
jgi:hypothetical protein